MKQAVVLFTGCAITMVASSCSLLTTWPEVKDNRAGSSGKGATTGGSTSGDSGGVKNQGGAPHLAGSSGQGGQTNTGGTASSNGGASTAGRGSESVGGTTTSGGTALTGGTATGGSAPLGGNSSTGGANANGGLTSTGGIPSTGGTNASGGKAATGGASQAGGCASATATAGTSCDDGNACTINDTCQNGVCAGGTPKTCAAPATCRGVGTCDSATGTCNYPLSTNNSSCDDGNPCTQFDACQGGVCAGTAMICNSPPPCHLMGACSAGTCTYPTAATDATTDLTCPSATQKCSAGSCVQCTLDLHCASPTPSCDPSTHKCVCRRPSAGNLVQNGGFDTSVAGWTADAVWDSEDSDGCPGSGSAFAPPASEVALSLCIPITGGQKYYFGAKLKDIVVDGFCAITPHAVAGCMSGGIAGGVDIGRQNVSAWTSFSNSFTAPANAISANIWCQAVQVKIDQVYLNASYNQF